MSSFLLATATIRRNDTVTNHKNISSHTNDAVPKSQVRTNHKRSTSSEKILFETNDVLLNNQVEADYDMSTKSEISVGPSVEDSKESDKNKLYRVAEDLLNSKNFEATLGTTAECEIPRNVFATEVSESDEVKDYYERASNILDETIRPSKGYTEFELSEKKKLYNAANALVKEKVNLRTYKDSSSESLPTKRQLFPTEVIQNRNVMGKDWKKYNWDVEHTRMTSISKNVEPSTITTKNATGEFLLYMIPLFHLTLNHITHLTVKPLKLGRKYILRKF